MNKDVSLSVVIPVFNCRQYIKTCVDSILSQTLSADEIILVDDHSTDGTYEIVQQYAHKYPQIKIQQLPPKQRGERRTAKALNIGLSLANGEYIALMDADDWCEPQRLRIQKNYLEQHRHVVAVGSNVFVKYEHKVRLGLIRQLKKPATNNELQMRLIKNSPFYQNTVMMRRSVLNKHNLSYDESFEYAEDYEFFSRLCRFGEVANIQHPLVTYRIHQKQSIAKPDFRKYIKKTAKREIKRLFHLSEAEAEAYWNFINHREGLSNADVTDLLAWQIFLIQKNDRFNFFDFTAFKNFMDEVVFERIISRKKYHPFLVAQLFRNVSLWQVLSNMDKTLVFIAKCLAFRSS